MNAQNDKHLCDSVARVTHAAGDSFCVETHHCTMGNVSHHKSTNAHRYLFIFKHKGGYSKKWNTTRCFSWFFTAIISRLSSVSVHSNETDTGFNSLGFTLSNTQKEQRKVSIMHGAAHCQ